MSHPNSTPHTPSRLLKRVSPTVAILIMGVVFIPIMAFINADQSLVITSDGEKVFNTVCATCHKLDPPANMDQGKPIAPPMRMIMMHYRAAFSSQDSMRVALDSWLQGTDSTKSVLPAMAIKEHGLMPKLVLNEEDRAAVITFIMALEKPEKGHKMEGMKGKMNH